MEDRLLAGAAVLERVCGQQPSLRLTQGGAKMAGDPHFYSRRTVIDRNIQFSFEWAPVTSSSVSSISIVH